LVPDGLGSASSFWIESPASQFGIVLACLAAFAVRFAGSLYRFGSATS
jgi:hypothetical protein